MGIVRAEAAVKIVLQRHAGQARTRVRCLFRKVCMIRLGMHWACNRSHCQGDGEGRHGPIHDVLAAIPTVVELLRSEKSVTSMGRSVRPMPGAYGQPSQKPSRRLASPGAKIMLGWACTPARDLSLQRQLRSWDCHLAQREISFTFALVGRLCSRSDNAVKHKCRHHASAALACLSAFALGTLPSALPAIPHRNSWLICDPSAWPR